MSNRTIIRTVIKALAVSTGYIIIATMLLSCRSTHTMTHSERKKLDVFTNISKSSDTINSLRSRIDSLNRRTMQMDSLIHVMKEREYERSVTDSRLYYILRDSMSVGIDSLGNWTYRYWSWSDRREEVHDTVYRDRVVESDTRRVSILRDSIAIYKERLDSLVETSRMRDSTYNALIDSLDNHERITEEKRRGIADRAADGIATIAMLLIIIFALTACVKWALKKNN